MMRLNLEKINKKSIFIGIISFIVFLEILVMSPRTLETQNSDAFDDGADISYMNQANPNAIDQKMQGVHLVENHEHEKGWELFASEATGKADGQWILKKVKVQFFHQNKSNYIVTGDMGEIEAQTKDMIISGNVTTISTNGYSFKTDTLRYISKQKMMTSLDRVTMSGPPDNSGGGFQLVGEKLLVDMQKNRMSILDKISAKKQMSGQAFNLTSSRADFSNLSQEATFVGNVKMSLGPMQAKAPMANFHYNSVKKQLAKIFMSDRVEFIEGNKIGSCREIEFDLLANQMTMRGQPKVIMGEDEILGHEIVFIDGGKKVKINRAPKDVKP